MPFRDAQTHLEDILESSDTISLFLNGMDFPSYQADLKTRLAIERLLQKLTEAAYRLGADGIRVCPSIDWRSVRNLGNVLRHEYHAVDEQRIWLTLKQDLPPLHSAVQQALREYRGATEEIGSQQE